MEGELLRQGQRESKEMETKEDFASLYNARKLWRVGHGATD